MPAQAEVLVTGSQVVEVVESGSAVQVLAAPTQVVEVASTAGPPGPPGAGALVWTQPTPLATWTFSHSLGRKPLVAVIVGGVEVIADVEFPDDMTVVVTHATPQTGEVIAA